MTAGMDVPPGIAYNARMDAVLGALRVRLVVKSEEGRYRELMARHHYLGDLAKIGHTLWYVAVHGEEWVALLGFSAAAWKCGVRDRWIGWSMRQQYARLPLLANNSRFLILPAWHRPNLGSRVLALCQQRLAADWQQRFGQRLLLLETFVDPARFQGTVYRAANWTCLGLTQGFRRIRGGYTAQAQAPKLVLVRPLAGDAAAQLAASSPPFTLHRGAPKMMLSADHMRMLPDFFATIPDPRRAQGRRHPLPSVLAIATAATLCGMRGYKAIAGWAADLSQRARERFRCRREKGFYRVPSESIIRDVLIRVDPVALDAACQQWNRVHARDDATLAVDGKTMCNAQDEAGRQVHVMSVVGHDSGVCYTQKKSAFCP